LPETVQGYPKWRGELRGGPRFLSIAIQEGQRAWDNQWVRAALLFGVGYSVIRIVLSGARAPTFTELVQFMDLLRWAAVVVVATIAGPALVEDSRRGALDLYRSRGVAQWDYVAGKFLAVWAFAFVAVALPALLRYGATFLVTESHPLGWKWAWAGLLGDAAIWSLVMTSIGLGLSAVARSPRAATIILIGGLAILDGLFGLILKGITKAEEVWVASPRAQMAQQTDWLYVGATAPYAFPYWWGLIGLGVLFILGVALVAWRQPRIKGVG
jgi:ABC-type transport system involved in multi-copper enzyme maturation permease subunit